MVLFRAHLEFQYWLHSKQRKELLHCPIMMLRMPSQLLANRSRFTRTVIECHLFIDFFFLLFCFVLFTCVFHREVKADTKAADPKNLGAVARQVFLRSDSVV